MLSLKRPLPVRRHPQSHLLLDVDVFRHNFISLTFFSLSRHLTSKELKHEKCIRKNYVRFHIFMKCDREKRERKGEGPRAWSVGVIDEGRIGNLCSLGGRMVYRGKGESPAGQMISARSRSGRGRRRLCISICIKYCYE